MRVAAPQKYVFVLYVGTSGQDHILLEMGLNKDSKTTLNLVEASGLIQILRFPSLE